MLNLYCSLLDPIQNLKFFEPSLCTITAIQYGDQSLCQIPNMDLAKDLFIQGSYGNRFGTQLEEGELQNGGEQDSFKFP